MAFSTSRLASRAVASSTAARARPSASSTFLRASSRYARVWSRAACSRPRARAFTSRSRPATSSPRTSTRAASSRTCCSPTASSRSRTSSSRARASTVASSASSVRSRSGTARSAMSNTSPAIPRRRAMASPYERPGTPLSNRKVGVASCFNAPRCVVARVTARRRVSVFRTAAASAAPSAGSVPLPISSSRTSEPDWARSRMSFSTATWAEKVERLAAMD